VSKLTPGYTLDDITTQYNLTRSQLKIAPTKAEVRKSWLRQPDLSKQINTKVFLRWLIKKATRSDSGVLVVTLVTKPGPNIKFSCPERCAYCPTETDLEGNPTQPKSYISSEPAMRRALQHNFDVKDQILDRLQAYLNTGNAVLDGTKKKIEVILSGGTWDVMPLEYRTQTINEIYWGFNVANEVLSNKSSPRQMKSIQEEIDENQTAVFGIIGLTIETRPDYVRKTSIKQYLSWGITRVQLGVQHILTPLLKLIDRGCTNQDTIRAIRLLKGVGLKVVVHLMPDLPFSFPELDKWMFNEVNSDPNLQFDDVKIYPCAVIKSHDPSKYKVTSKISEWYESGAYVPYSEKNIQKLIDVLIEYKSSINPWVRIERLVRDIPAHSMDAGYNKISNLRQVIHKQMESKGLSCKCIRCMEIRFREYSDYKLVVRPYAASKGQEYHISVETETKVYHWAWIWYLIKFWIVYLLTLGTVKLWYAGSRKHYSGLLGFCRLRIDPEPGLGFVPELEGAGLIRELHVYGQIVCVGMSIPNGLQPSASNSDKISNSAQHKGFGQLLMSTAETIVKSHGLNKIAVIAGIGAREYYRTKCGYELEGTYMCKTV
jgi:ELP3 family radical SAM enzyme/protein acetyltransferase